MKKYKVLIKKCETYDRRKINGIIRQGMKEFNLEPAGKIFIKPNVVFADYDEKTFPGNAYTNKDFLAGLLLALRMRPAVEKISIGENCGIGIPNRLFYRWSGYYKLIRELKAGEFSPLDPEYCEEEDFPPELEIYSLEEDRFVEKFVGGSVHSYVRLSKKITDSDFKIAVPKLKKHSSVDFTCCVKLNIGVVDDAERSIRHDYGIGEKICDLHQASPYDFYAVDAIEAGVGIETSPDVRNLGAVIMGTNAVAIDMVAAYLYGLDWKETYLKTAVERGLGPKSLDEIEIAGDFNDMAGLDLEFCFLPKDENFNSVAALDILKAKLKPYDEKFYRWHESPDDLKRLNSPITYHHGPTQVSPEIWCKAGCVMGTEISFSFLERYDAAGFKNAPLAIIIGKHEEIDCGGKVAILLGKCTEVKRLKNAKKTVKIERCFATVLDMLPYLIWHGGFKNPMLRPKFLAGVARAVVETVAKKIITGRYLQEIYYFLKYKALKKI